MRISTDVNDAGYEHSEGRLFDIFLDGVPVANVITADEELGLILHDPDPKTPSAETLRGVVRIEPKERA